MYKIADSHNDFLDVLDLATQKKYLSGEVRECGVEVITGAICCADKKNDFYTEDRLLAVARAVEDLEIRVLLEYEGLDFLTKSNLDILEKARPFAVTLTWNNDNSLAGGCRGSMGKGLTPFGFEVAKFLKNNDIAIDTAHLNRASFFDLAKTDARIYNSHTCIADVFSDDFIMERNITVEQAGIIIERGGFVGITLIPYFLCGKESDATVEDIFSHIDSVVQKYGDNHIGIGSDFYGAKSYPQGISNYYGFHSIAKTLQKHGYLPQSIQKILHTNFLDFSKSG